MISRRRSGHLLAIASSLLALTSAAQVESGCTSVFVPGDANIFAAGHTTIPDFPGGDGSLPVEYRLLPSGGPVQITQTVGLISCCGNPNGNGAEGDPCCATNLSSFGGISGIAHDRMMFLVGVFLAEGVPQGPAPVGQDFSGADDFTDLYPELGQTFFIGDGLTGDDVGAWQRFHPPAGATRLFLGFGDGYGFVGSPGGYEDNIGQLEVSLSVPGCECGSVERYCVASPNSSGRAARIDLSGSLSVSANDTVLSATQCPSGAIGFFFYGQGRVNHSFGDGVLCINPLTAGLYRVGSSVLVDGAGQVSLALDLTSLSAAGAILPGATWSFQLLVRDPAAGGTGVNTSDALELTFCP